MSLTCLQAVGTILFLIFIWCWIYYLKRREMTKLINKIPGPPTVPLFGNALDFLSDHSEFLPRFLRYSEKWPRLIRYWIGVKPYVIVYHHKTVESILSSSAISKGEDYDRLRPWLGMGLLTSDGDKWKLRRRLLTPAFHFRILKDFLIVFNEQSDILVQKLSTHLGKEVDIFPFITNCALDIICDTAMGRHVNAQSNNASDYAKAMDRIKDIVHSRQTLPWLWPDWIFHHTQIGKEHNSCLNMLHAFTEKVINERKAEWNPAEKIIQDEINVYERKRRLAFLDLLLDASDGGKVLSNDDIREEVDTFMFEGHDTTAAAISWAIYLLGTSPDIQEKVHVELDAIFGSDKSRHVTPDDLTQMNYLECVIKETLRIFPSVPVITRSLHEKIIIDGYTIPKNATIMISPYLLHRDSEVFPDPEVFDPDRFSLDNSNGRNPYAYVPFSAGPRNCIGQKFAVMEEKVVLSHVLRSYRVHSLEPRESIRAVAELILKSTSGIKIYLTPRN